MKELKRILELEKDELGIIINALYELRNKLISEEKDSYTVDKVLLKTLDAPYKKSPFRRSTKDDDR